ncbi:MAG: hypothetical protein H0W72_13820 [Planctomycetes bacterium]|nr:hypothetical protein [Planctomycetota bacterium]
MAASLWQLTKAAFNARPLGMPVPPNWIALAGVAMLGLINPGFWVLGAGLELGYLGWLTHNPRFRSTVVAPGSGIAAREQGERAARLVEQLAPADLTAYRRLEERCRGIIDQQALADVDAAALASQGEGLNRLLWIYLRLFATRGQIGRIGEDDGREERRLRDKRGMLEQQLAETGIADDLRRSLEAQLDIVRQRLEKRSEASGKLDYLDAEIERIAEQVELIREQAMLASDPKGVSERIDQVTATLGGTNEWIREQQAVLGQVEDLAAAPALLSRTPERAKEKA